MNKIMKTIVSVCVIGITMGTAYARTCAPHRGPVGYHHTHVVHHCPPPRIHVIHPGHHHHYYHSNCPGSAIIGGIVGGIVGTLVSK